MYYNVGNRLEQIVHTRLRSDYSLLNEHLFNKTPVASPNFMCGELETDKHFHDSCNKNKLILVTCLHTEQLKIILFGKAGLNNEKQ